MNRTRIAAVLALALSLSACAGNAPSASSAAVTTLKADPAQVVEVGAVRPVDGITSSGQPNEAALKVYAESGYVAVVDLRSEKESRGFDEPTVVRDLGMEYVPLPIAGKQGISLDNAVMLDQLLEKYNGPVLVHCGSGNRVGALLALARIEDGMEQEAAIEYGKAAGMTVLEGRVREVLEQN